VSSLYIDGLSVPGEIKAALTELSNNHEFTKEVTKGANGYLFFGKNKILKTKVAVKFYYWGAKNEYHAEPKNLAAIEAENILTIHDASLIDNGWAYFVTAYCPNGDLDNYIEGTAFGNLEAVDLISGALTGLSHLHANRFVHRDLKPSNIYLNNDRRVVIGDFGSLKSLPKGQTEIPTSSHSILYSPPEAVTQNTFGFEGDIYQLGIVLYQLLGGHLSYDEISWMSKPELSHYGSLTDQCKKSIYVDKCIKAKIIKGKILNIKTLPPWVPDSLKKIIRKATNVDNSKRFPNATAFKTNLHRVRSAIWDWYLDEGIPTLRANTSYRILKEGNGFQIQKKRNGDWRKDNSIPSSDLDGIIRDIQGKS
jgi:eukaryotic-like serine/threonine-protein kinase